MGCWENRSAATSRGVRKVRYGQRGFPSRFAELACHSTSHSARFLLILNMLIVASQMAHNRFSGTCQDSS